MGEGLLFGLIPRVRRPSESLGCVDRPRVRAYNSCPALRIRDGILHRRLRPFRQCDLRSCLFLLNPSCTAISRGRESRDRPQSQAVSTNGSHSTMIPWTGINDLIYRTAPPIASAPTIHGAHDYPAHHHVFQHFPQLSAIDAQFPPFLKSFYHTVTPGSALPTLQMKAAPPFTPD
jgi:hypothetical protein